MIKKTNTKTTRGTDRFGPAKLAPNPAQNFVQVQFATGNPRAGVEVELMDMNGRMVRFFKLNGNASSFMIPLVGLQKSFYIVRLKQDGKVLQTEKLIIN